MSIELTGKVIKVLPTNNVNDKFCKREFVLEVADNPTYPETIIMEVIQDKCDSLDHMKVGDTVTAHLNLKGRKWQKDESSEIRYFNTIQCWKFDKSDQSAPPPTSNQSFTDEEKAPWE